VVFVTTIGPWCTANITSTPDNPTDQLCSPPNRTARAACPSCWQATSNAQGQIVECILANSYVSTDGAWVISYARSAQAHLAMLASVGTASPRGRMRPVGDRLGPHLYTGFVCLTHVRA
jgi:hypothetical protein